MTQVIIFFGWLVIGIAVNLVVFGHVSIFFVYDINTLVETIFPEDGMSSVVYSAASLVPGSIMLGVGKLMQHYENKAAAREATEAQEAQDASDGDAA